MTNPPAHRKSGGKSEFPAAFLNVSLTPERETLAEFDIFNYDFLVFND
jgi:hypothetical protein